MDNYTLKYQIEHYGDTIKLLSVVPESDYVTECFYEGKLLTNVFLNSNGVFEMRVVHIYEEDTDHFGIVSLEKLYRGKGD